MDNTDMSADAITFRLKKVSQLRKLCVALKIGGKEKQPINKHVGAEYILPANTIQPEIIIQPGTIPTK
ncbi:MAG: hypothetical protein KBA66_14090 [Leptospiraceae bacterium]|nr:hypothetical protein [Leptospiraceae bacterium]